MRCVFLFHFVPSINDGLNEELCLFRAHRRSVTRIPGDHAVIPGGPPVKPQISLLLVVLLSVSSLYAQEHPVIEWVKLYDGISRRQLQLVSPCLDRNGMIWGTATYVNAAKGQKIAPMCFSPSGDSTLFEVYDSASGGSVVSTSMALDDSGGAYVTGNSYLINGTTEGVLLRYTSGGKIAWVLHFPMYATGCNVVHDSTGNIILGICGGDGIHVWKINQQATILDSNVITCDTATLSLCSLVLADSGSVYLMDLRIWSHYSGPPGMPIDFAEGDIIKMDSHLNVLWKLKTDPLFAGAVRCDRQGNLVALTASALTKVSNNGTVLWHTPTSTESSFLGLAVDSQSRTIVCGDGSYEEPFFGIASYESTGNLAWGIPFSNSATTRYEFRGIGLDSSDNVYATGNIGSYLPGTVCPIMKWDAAGNKIWETTFQSSDMYSMGTSIFVDRHGSVYVVGSGGEENNLGLLVLKYAQRGTTAVIDPSVDMPIRSKLCQNYPNPFNPSTNIGYTIASSKEQVAGSMKQVGMERVRLAVYDLLGREVAVLVDGYQTPGEHHVMFDARSLASGVYFYRLVSGGSVQTRKMTFVR